MGDELAKRVSSNDAWLAHHNPLHGYPAFLNERLVFIYLNNRIVENPT